MALLGVSTILLAAASETMWHVDALCLSGRRAVRRPGEDHEQTYLSRFLACPVFLPAYEYAWCVDYIQTGNEVFGGAGGYKFYEDELQGTGCTWTGDPRTFQYIPTPNGSNDCKEEAFALVKQWLHEQAWAALEGSALAGRPLRIVGPGIIHSHVIAAHDYQSGGGEGEIAFYIMDNIVPWLNENQMHFDMHLHYRSVSDGLDSIDDLTDPNSNWGGPPDWCVSREWGPATSDDTGGWATGQNVLDFVKFRSDYTTQGPCSSNCCSETPTDSDWDDFTLRWREEEFLDDFQMDTFLGALSSSGWSFVCYGPVHMASPAIVELDVAALRSQLVCTNLMESSRLTNGKYFTPLTDEYEIEAASYEITFPQDRRSCPECD